MKYVLYREHISLNYAPYKIKSIIDCRIWDKITEVYNECL